MNPSNPMGEMMLNEVGTYGQSLAESRLWKPFVEDVQNDFQRRATAVVLSTPGVS